MPKVTFITESLRQYRGRFHELLREELNILDIEYHLIYGRASSSEQRKKDEIDLDWATKVENKYFRIGEINICWQPCWKYIKNTDLVIVEQANKHLINYLLMIKRIFGGPKLAFEGHGRNFQSSNKNNLKELFKQTYIRQVDWWFAYNELSAQIVKDAGFPSTRLTDTQNSIDMEELIKAHQSMRKQNIISMRREFGLGMGPIGVFCGAMYKEKRMDFLVNACRLIKEKVSDFEMIFIGDGPDSTIVSQAALTMPWIHYVGPKFDTEKVKYLKMGNILLMPGLVGLVILDSFALQIPLVTTKYHGHSPEIIYLKNDTNGIITEDNFDDYVSKTVNLLGDPVKYNRIVKGCIESARKYSIENMVHNFVSGIQKCLEMN